MCEIYDLQAGSSPWGPQQGQEFGSRASRYGALLGTHGGRERVMAVLTPMVDMATHPLCQHSSCCCHNIQTQPARKPTTWSQAEGACQVSLAPLIQDTKNDIVTYLIADKHLSVSREDVHFLLLQMINPLDCFSAPALIPALLFSSLSNDSAKIFTATSPQP